MLNDTLLSKRINNMSSRFIVLWYYCLSLADNNKFCFQFPEFYFKEWEIKLDVTIKKNFAKKVSRYFKYLWKQFSFLRSFRNKSILWINLVEYFWKKFSKTENQIKISKNKKNLWFRFLFSILKMYYFYLHF